MRNLAFAAALLGSTAILRMMPDASGGAGGEPVPEFMSTIDALNSLDPNDDTNWTADGLPDVDVMEALTGNKWLSRGDLEGFPIDRATAKASKDAAVPLIPPVPETDLPPPVDQAPPPDALPADPAPVDPATPETPPVASADDPAPIVEPEVPPATPPSPPTPITLCRLVVLTFDASAPFDGGTAAVGLVVKVNDDGSCNVKAFSPDGGSDGFFTGVRNMDDVLAMPDGAEKNGALACTWSFPPRV